MSLSTGSNTWANVRKPWRRGVALWLVLGLLVPLPVLLLVWYFRNRPKAVIRRALKADGLSDRTIEYWTAISAFETAYPPGSSARPWSSPVFRKSRNLFNLVIPGSIRLETGEGQTVFPEAIDSARALISHVLVPYGYPRDPGSLGELVEAMSDRQFFVSDPGDYLKGVKVWYDKLYTHGQK